MKIKVSVIIAAAVMLLFVAFGLFDYSRFKAEKKPIFIVKKDVLNDGGTTAYYGIGYQIVNWKIMDSEINGDRVLDRYLVGSEFRVLKFIDPLNDEPGVMLKREQ